MRAETINGLYKTEVINRCGPWRSFEAVEWPPSNGSTWYFNNRRLLEPIGNIPPAEAEANHYAQIDEFGWRSNQTASGKPGAVQW